MANAAERLSAELRALREAAGKPKLDSLTSLGGGGTGRASTTSIGDWLNGRTVPGDARYFMTLVKHLRTLAEARGASGPLYAEGQWQALLARATAERDKHRGGRPATTPGRGASPASPMTLPPPPDFAGRADRVGELLDLLIPEAAAPRPVAVTGMGGVGKTAFVLHTAHEAQRRGWFPGGVVFADLHGYGGGEETGADAVLRRFLIAFGRRPADIPPTFDEKLDVWRTLLRMRAERYGPALILLDNVRATQVASLFPGAPHRTLLTTRRSWSGRQVRSFPLDVLSYSDAQSMLELSLTAGGPGADERIAGEPGAVRELTAQCGHLPLALYIVAALLRRMPQRSMAEQVAMLGDARDRLAKLRHAEDQDDGRPLAVRASFALSYEHLTAGQALAFRLLSAASGPDLSCEAADALLGGGSDEVLADLREAHLLSEDTDGRLSMHDLVRLFAGELGEAQALPDGRGVARERLLDWYVATAREAGERLNGAAGTARFPDRMAAVGWLDAERANLGASARAAVEYRLDRQASGLAHAQADFLVQYRHLEDALEMADTALVAARSRSDAFDEARALHGRGLALTAQGHAAEAITAHQEAVDVLNRAGYDGAVLGSVLNGLGVALSRVHRHAAAMEVHTRSLEIFRARGDRRGEAQALAALGTALFDAYRLPEAREQLETCVALLRESTDLRTLSAALGSLGQVLRESADFEAAVEVHREEEAVDRAMGDQHALAMTLTSLGGALSASHRFEEAVTVCSEAARLFKQLDDRAGEALAGNNLGVAQVQLFRYDDAVRTHRAVLEVYETLNDPWLLGDGLLNLAAAIGGQGDQEEALALFDRALAVLEPLGDGPRVARVLTGSGQILIRLERHAEAVQHLERAVALLAAAGDRRTGGTLGMLSEALWHLKRYDEAATRHQEGVAALRGIGDHRALAVALTRQFFVQQQSGDTEAAIATCTEVVNLYQQVGDRVMEASIRMWLGTLFKFDSRIAECREQWRHALGILPPGANPDLETGLRFDLDALPPED